MANVNDSTLEKQLTKAVSNPVTKKRLITKFSVTGKDMCS